MHVHCTCLRVMDTQNIKRRLYAYCLLGGVFVLMAVLAPRAQAQTKGEDRIVESPMGFASNTDRDTAIGYLFDLTQTQLGNQNAHAFADLAP